MKQKQINRTQNSRENNREIWYGYAFGQVRHRPDVSRLFGSGKMEWKTHLS